MTAPRWAFVLGTGRCGSTLVHEVLCRHPDIGFVTNVDDKLRGLDPSRRFSGAVFRRLPPSATQKGRLRYAPSEAYRVLEREVSPALSAPFRDLRAEDATPWLVGRLRAFFEPRAAASAAPVFSHKFTGWPRSGLLTQAFPDARFIHIVRDGRAVANSFLQMDWWSGWGGPDRWSWGPLPTDYAQAWEDSGRSFTVLAGLNWRVLIDAYEQARAALPEDRWLELRYEDVLADPLASFATMLDFLGLPASRVFDAGLQRYRFTSSRSEAFRRDLPAADTASLEAVLDEPLRRYGYV